MRWKCTRLTSAAAAHYRHCSLVLILLIIPTNSAETKNLPDVLRIAYGKLNVSNSRYHNVIDTRRLLLANLTASTTTTTATPDSESVLGIFWMGAATDHLQRWTAGEGPWRQVTKRSGVRSIRKGCGRMQNRLVVLESGQLFCARYRQNNDQLQGELFSFYLAQELGIRNLPPTVLVRPVGKVWEPVRSVLELAQWRSDRPIILTKFIDGLAPVHIPVELRNTSRRLHPHDIKNKTLRVGRELVQWSDLIVFDYLTANLDRIVNNMLNLQWNPDMMNSPAHNLARQSSSGLLVFLDNESGLVHGYRLLERYEPYQRDLLNSLCLFRKSTADAVKRLVERKDIGERLLEAFRRNDPGMEDWLPFLPTHSIKVLNERLARVYDQIQKCRNMYNEDIVR